MSIPKAIDKIPKRHLEEFLQQQTGIFKSRTQLAGCLFVFTFMLGSIITTLVLKETFNLQLMITWAGAISVSTVMFIASKKASTVRAAKICAALFIVLYLSVLTSYYIITRDAPFNVGMVWVFGFIGCSLMFPWSVHEVIGVLLLHMTAYMIYLMNAEIYRFKNAVYVTEPADYIQGFVIMLTSFFFCHIINKRERAREVENYILLKEIEEKSAQMKHELELATRVHSRLIPHSASTRLADIAVTYVPMYYMGGDYAKFHLIDKNKLIFIICDVTGHGVSAALLVNALNSEFERLVKEGKKPGALLRELDRFIANDFAGVNMYLTAFCGLLDYSGFARTFTYSSYGHPPQYLYRTNDSRVERIAAQTSFLGLPIEDDTVYENEVPFAKGDQIVLFTDGVIEAQNAGGMEYGSERLEAFVRQNNAMDTTSFNQKLLRELNLFTGNKRKDDVFVLNIKTK